MQKCLKCRQRWAWRFLPYIDELIDARRKLTNLYDQLLSDSDLQLLRIREHTTWNFSYYPVIFETEKDLLAAEEKLNKLDIVPRRYFYPSLNRLPYTDKKEMKISENISNKILCLPLHSRLSSDEQILIVKQLKKR